MSHTPSRRSRRALLAVAAAVLLGSALPTPDARAGIVDCAPGQTYTWDGGGDGSSWSDSANWDLDCTPGLVYDGDGKPKPQTDTAVLPAGASATLSDGEQAQLARLANSGTVTVTSGAVINTRLNSTSAHLVLRGLLYGTGRFTVTGTLDWVSTSSGAATQSTRRCSLQDCSSPAPSPGTTVIARGATMNVSGRGVALSDQRLLENRGTVVVSGQGYIAADYGTTFRNLRAAGAPAAPRFVLRNDGGYYQGVATAGQPLGAFINTGLVVKEAGSGRSVIDAAYAGSDSGTSATGRVEIRSGTLFITVGDPGPESAFVKQGTSFGNGGRRGTTAGDPQAESVQLSKPGSALPEVTIEELAPVAGARGVPVHIRTPGAQATSAAPLRFRFFFDSTLVRPGETPASVASTARVYRSPDGASTYALLPTCGPGGPTAAQACVDRALSKKETAALSGGDVVLVVESLQNSRFKVS